MGACESVFLLACWLLTAALEQGKGANDLATTAPGRVACKPATALQGSHPLERLELKDPEAGNMPICGAILWFTCCGHAAAVVIGSLSLSLKPFALPFRSLTKVSAYHDSRLWREQQRAALSVTSSFRSLTLLRPGGSTRLPSPSPSTITNKCYSTTRYPCK